MRIDYSMVRYVLANYQELSHGDWPDPQVYESLVRSKQISCHAPYEEACLLAGEVSDRVRVCGEDGLFVEECYGINRPYRKKPSRIARERHMDFRKVCSKINKVLWYCTDDKKTRGRRQESYDDWKSRTKHYHHYRETAKGITLVQKDLTNDA